MTASYPPLAGRRAELKREWEAIAFWRLLGMEAAGLDEGRCWLRLPVRDELLAPGAVLHGGFYGCLIDTAIGSALKCFPDLDRPEAMVSTIDLNVSYLRPALAGVVEVDASILRRTRRLAWGEAAVTGAEGELLAKGRATFAISIREGERAG